MILTRLALLAAVFGLGGIALGQGYSVTGEVNHPGTYPLSERSSIMRAISLAGGLTKAANPENVVIIRENREIPVNVKSVMNGKAKDIALLDGDAVIVPVRVPGNQPYLIAPSIFSK